MTEPSSDYELIDSGDGEKLERFGKIVLSRPDPQALWSKKLDISEWKKANGSFTREEGSGWSLSKGMVDKWTIELGGLKFIIKPTAFKHVGLFPEQSVNWEWLKEQVQSDPVGDSAESKVKVQNSVAGAELEVLNLFGYTGGATLACARADAKVVHVDGSKSAIAWARENAEASGLDKKPVRWILDDARAFVSREIKRDRKYDGIIMDPPAFGHGPDNELWKIEENFLPLVKDCFKILKDKPSFFLINGYSAGYSAVAYENILLPLVEKYGGSIEIGELVIKEGQNSVTSENTDSQLSEPRLLPCGIFARWSAK